MRLDTNQNQGKGRKNPSFTVLALIVMVCCFTLGTAVGYADEAWYPDSGDWEGTAPSCDGECGSDQFAWCASANGGCAYSNAYSPADFGHICTSGRKAYCVDVDDYPQVTDYDELNEVGEWVGTAPSCSGFCEEDDEFALCRSAWGDRCAYADGIDAQLLEGHGDDCTSGRKAFCVPIEYIEPDRLNEQGPKPKK